MCCLMGSSSLAWFVAKVVFWRLFWSRFVSIYFWSLFLSVSLGLFWILVAWYGLACEYFCFTWGSLCLTLFAVFFV